MPKHIEKEFSSTNNSSVEQLSTILSITQTINSANLDLDQTLVSIVEEIRVKLNYPLVSIFLLQKSSDQAVLKAFSSIDHTQLVKDQYVVTLQPRSAMSICRGQGKPVVSKRIGIIQNDPRDAYLKGLQACAILPLHNKNQIFAFLEICSQNVSFFPDVQIQNLQLLSTNCSATLQTCLNLSSYQRKLASYKELQTLASGLTQQPNKDEIIRNVVQSLNKHIPDSRISFLAPETNGRLRVKCCAGFTDTEANTLKLDPGRSAAELAASELKAKNIEDITLISGMCGLALDTHSIMAVPVQYVGTLLGVLNVENSQVRAFSEDDMEIVSASANYLARILSNMSCTERNAQQIEKQKRLYEITNKIRQSTNVETILRTFSEEICNEFNFRKVTIRVDPEFLLSTNASPERLA